MKTNITNHIFFCQHRNKRTQNLIVQVSAFLVFGIFSGFGYQVCQLHEKSDEIILLLVEADGHEDQSECNCDPQLGSQERFGQTEEGPHEEEADVNDGNDGGQQLHEDDSSVGAVETLDVDVLLLSLLVFNRIQLSLQTLKVFLYVQ